MSEFAVPPCVVPAGADVTTAAQWQQQHPTWLLEALRSGHGVDHGGTEPGREYRVELHRLGDLPLPDGRLIGCDPYLADVDQLPFTVTLAPGEHPVGVGIVHLDDDHRRPTALVLVTGAAPIVRWSFAELDGGADGDEEEPEDSAIGTVLGYGVDAGTGAFLSPAALPALVEVGREDGGMLEDPLSVGMDASPWEAVLLPPRPGSLPVAQAHSGWGDGVYATWVGWAADDTVSLVMTDFDVLTDPWVAAQEVPDPAPVPPPVRPRTLGERLRKLLG